MTQDTSPEEDPKIETSDSITSPNTNAVPRHFTRQPLWVIPLSGVIVVLLTIWKINKFQAIFPGVSLWLTLPLTGIIASLAAAVLVVRSHVRSKFWANVTLWLGLLAITLAICAVSILMDPR